MTDEAETRADERELFRFAWRAAAVMRRRLQDGLRRGWGLSFRSDYPDAANLHRLDRALGHLEDALARFRENSVSVDEVRSRAADVANQAFMLADNDRLLNNPGGISKDAHRYFGDSTPPFGTWRDLIAAVKRHEEWYLPTRMGVNAWVGVGSTGRYYGGVSVEGDPLSADDMGYEPMEPEGTSPQEVLAGLVEALGKYEADRDRERAEMAEEMAP